MKPDGNRGKPSKKTNSPRFSEVKRQLDKAPKANPMQDKLLIWIMIFIVVAGLFFLSLGLFTTPPSVPTPTPTKTALLISSIWAN